MLCQNSSATVGEPNTVYKIYYSKAKKALYFTLHNGYDIELYTVFLDGRKSISRVSNFGTDPYDDIENYAESLTWQSVPLRQLNIENAEVRVESDFVRIDSIFHEDRGLDFDIFTDNTAHSEWKLSLFVENTKIESFDISACLLSTFLGLRAYSLPGADFVVYVFAPINICMEGGYRDEFFYIQKKASLKDISFAPKYVKTKDYELQLNLNEKGGLTRHLLALAEQLAAEKQEQSYAELITTALRIDANSSDKLEAFKKVLDWNLNSGKEHLVYSSLREFLTDENTAEERQNLSAYIKANSLYSSVREQRWFKLMFEDPLVMPYNLAGVNNIVSLAQVGAVKLIDGLLTNGADVNFYDKQNRSTALFAAVENRDAKLVEYLLSKNAVDSFACYNNMTAFQLAVKDSLYDIAKMLISVTDANNMDRSKFTPLLYAVEAERLDVISLLLNKGADINHVSRSYSYYSPLQKALFEKKNVELAQFLVDNGASVDILHKHYSTYLSLAVENKYYKGVEFLLKNGADPDLCVASNKTPLYEAMSQRNYRLIDMLLPVSDPSLIADSYVRAWNDTALFVKIIKRTKELGQINKLNDLMKTAVRYNKCQFVETLVAHDYTLEEKTGLLRLARKSEMIDCLFRHGISADAKNSQGETDLMTLLRYKNEDAVIRILDYPVDVNQSDNTSFNLLMRAVLFIDSTEIAHKLLSKGCRVNSIDIDGNTALHYACNSQNPQPKIELLLKYGADQNILNNKGEDVLYLSAKYSLDALKYLHQAGGDLFREYSGGRSLLFAAVGEKNKEIVSYLIQNGLDVNAKTTERKTLLHTAVENGDVETVLLLLQSGAKQIKAKRIGKPLDIAKRMKNDELVEILQKQ